MRGHRNFPQREESSRHITHSKECGNCGRPHDANKRESCHGYGVENAVKRIILLPNVGVGKIITQDKDVRLVDDDVDEEVY